MTSASRLARWLRRLAALFLCLTPCFLTAPLHAQAPPDLEPAATTSGLSLHQDFYNDLVGGMRDANVQRTAVYSGSAFVPHTDQAQSLFGQIETAFQTGYDAALAWLGTVLPEIALIVAAIVAFLLAIFCSGVQPTVNLDIPQASVYAAFTLDDLQIAQTSGGERLDLTLSDVGLISELQTEIGIGTCTDTSKDLLEFAYQSVHYQVDVQFLAGGGAQVSAHLVGALPGVDKTFDGGHNVTANTLWTIVNPAVGGSTLETKLAAFATNDVPDHLEEIFINWFVPYLAHPGWKMDLSGAKQTLRFGENAVNGTVGPALYGALQSDVAAHKVRVVFDNQHSAVSSNALATCADSGPFAGGPRVTPNFGAEGANAMGTYHTSYKSFEHAIIAGIRSAVGLRNEAKPGSDYIVEHSFADLVPEAGANSVQWLFRNASSPITPIPISPAQSNALVNAPADGAGLKVAQIAPGELTLKIRVCEVERPTIAFPLTNQPDGSGIVQHVVKLNATLERNGFVVYSENFDATFQGDLRLSKVATQNAIEFRTIRAELVSLVNGAGLDWQHITTSTPFASAPVSLFLRAFLGDNTLPTPLTDQRIFYLIEGLTGPLVERAAHGMVVLPGLDFAALNGAQFGFIAAAVPFHEDDFDLGLDYDHPAQCASIQRWGQTLAMVGGSPSGSDFMLTLEVSWSPMGTPQPFQTHTGVTATVFSSGSSPFALANPSRWDGGHLITSYFPTDGDGTRVMNASGDRIGDFLPGGGEHYVAATAVAYKYLREAYPSWQYPKATFELRPYRRVAALPPCNVLFPGPLYKPPHLGSHHESTPYDVYEALTFETRKECLGIGLCDGARVVAMWTAPLFHDCAGPDGPVGIDYHTFDTVEGTLRVPPSSYVYHLQNCAAWAGPAVGVPWD